MSNLKKWLVESELFFIPRGEHNVKVIYTYVQSSVPKMCDNSIPCQHEGSDYGQAEWKHQVRLALDALKKSGVTENKSRGVWKIN